MVTSRFHAANGVLLLVLSIILRTALAFTKESRSFQLQFQGNDNVSVYGVHFDIAVEALTVTATKACASLSCDPQEVKDIVTTRYLAKVEEEMRQSVIDFEQSIDSIISGSDSPMSWVPNGDLISQQKYSYSRRDIFTIIGGLPAMWNDCVTHTTAGYRLFHNQFKHAHSTASTLASQSRHPQSHAEYEAHVQGIYEDGVNSPINNVTITPEIEAKIKSIEQPAMKDGISNSCYFLKKYYIHRDYYTALAQDYCQSPPESQQSQVMYTCANYSLTYFSLSRHYFALMMLAEEMVNSGNFEFAAVLAHVCYHRLLPDIDVVSDLIATSSPASSGGALQQRHVFGEYYADTLMEAKFKNLLILTEINSEIETKGLGAAYACKLVLELENTNYYAKLGLHRLRMLLAVPAVPRTIEESESQRSVMIADLYAYARSNAENNIVISLEDLQAEVQRTPFHMAHQGLNDKDLQIAYYTALVGLCPSLSSTANHLEQLPLPPRRGPIRVGFISTHFGDHSIGKIMLESITRMSINGRVGNEFEVFVFYLDHTVFADSETGFYRRRPNDQLGDITNFFMNNLGDHFHFVPTKIGPARDIIASYALDFILYTDLGMDFASYAVAFSRLATYQAAWWGHPITSGLPSIDFYFGLDAEVKHADTHYSEQLIRMDYMSSAPVQRAQPRIANFTEIGIPAGAGIALVIARLFKFHPMFDIAVANILLHSSDNDFVIFVTERVATWNSIVFQRLRRTLELGLEEMKRIVGGMPANLTVDSYIKRLKFVDYENYVPALNAATLVLDTFPYGGCLTTHDSLANGTPMVTLPLEHVRGRYTDAMYAQMGVQGLVAQNIGDYVEIVLLLLRDKSYRDAKSREIEYKYYNTFNKNDLVSLEWMKVVRQLMNKY